MADTHPAEKLPFTQDELLILEEAISAYVDELGACSLRERLERLAIRLRAADPQFEEVV
jgi:hypothetical protein